MSPFSRSSSPVLSFEGLPSSTPPPSAFEHKFNGHYRPAYPLSPTFSACSFGSLSSASSFDPATAFRCPSWAVGTKPTSTTDCIDTATSRGGSQPSLSRFNTSIGDAPASPHLSWDAYGVTTVKTVVEAIQRAETAGDVVNTVPVVRAWLVSLPRLVREDATRAIRLAAIQLFFSVWSPENGNKFASFGEYDGFVVQDEYDHETISAAQTKRFANTGRGLVVAMLLGKLLKANILTSPDIALSAELLFANRQTHGYMRGLLHLLTFAGDKVCRNVTLGRMLALVNRLEEAKEELGLFEVKTNIYPIVNLIKAFRHVQARKTLHSLPRAERRF
ncbi:hypothetical protein DFH11DRAFT_1547158 [Phellopilus nigrolimitatus]|nr:hypothetical protein DFH11DRAFT_1547158 [Phellopilus nigrolimitatus]